MHNDGKSIVVRLSVCTMMDAIHRSIPYFPQQIDGMSHVRVLNDCEVWTARNIHIVIGKSFCSAPHSLLKMNMLIFHEPSQISRFNQWGQWIWMSELQLWTVINWFLQYGWSILIDTILNSTCGSYSESDVRRKIGKEHAVALSRTENKSHIWERIITPQNSATIPV